MQQADGSVEYCAPSAIANPQVRDVALPRADFQGAAWQFLIGLLQTALPPVDDGEWLDRLVEPPSVAELDAAFAPFADAFEFGGDGPRFMQDHDRLEDVQPGPVGGLLIDAPGARTVKLNTDFFVKRGRIDTLCPDCAAIALYTMQINAPAGGAGVRVGLRGGGPLTTLVLPEDENATLWSRLWANVMPRDAVGQKGQNWSQPSADDGDLFFWMQATRVSDRKGTEVLPDGMHPLHAYWAMPRRFWLLFEQEHDSCDLCGRPTTAVVRQIRSKKQGANYDGPWLHPLTPYRRDPKKLETLPLSTKGQPTGLGYRHWPDLILPDAEGSGAMPARMLQHYMRHKVCFVDDERAAGETFDALLKHPRLWVFGYDMSNMKARGWYSTDMPLVAVAPQSQDRLRDWVQSFVTLASQFAWMVRQQLRAAWFKRPGDAKGDMTQIEAEFFERSEPAFYDVLRQMGDVLAGDTGAAALPAHVFEAWYRRLKRDAMTVFEQHALSGSLEGLKTQQLARMTRARRSLQAFVNGSGKGGKTVREFATRGGFELQPARVNNPAQEAGDE
jgi:CRISPR system Cascade subunit CasA